MSTGAACGAANASRACLTISYSAKFIRYCRSKVISEMDPSHSGNKRTAQTARGKPAMLSKPERALLG